MQILRTLLQAIRWLWRAEVDLFFPPDRPPPDYWD
jgi:hypothetical protein